MVTVSHPKTIHTIRGKSTAVGNGVTIVVDVQNVVAGIADDFKEPSNVVDLIQTVAHTKSICTRTTVDGCTNFGLGACYFYDIIAASQRYDQFVEIRVAKADRQAKPIHPVTCDRSDIVERVARIIEIDLIVIAGSTVDVHLCANRVQDATTIGPL